MIVPLIAGGTLAAIVAKKLSNPKTSRLNINTRKAQFSDTVMFDITPYTEPAEGQITAIRVQDIPRQIWYNWDNGSWDALPEVKIGTANLYIAAQTTNVGGESGDLTLKIEDDMGNILASKTQTVAAGSGFGVEAPDLNMPSVTLGITISVSP